MKYRLEGLDCANCAAKLETQLRKAPGLHNAQVNFAAGYLEVAAEKLDLAREIALRAEPGVRIISAEIPSSGAAKGGNHPWGRIGLIAMSTILLAMGIIFQPRLRNTTGSWAEYAVFVGAYVIIGWRVVFMAFRNLWRGRVFDESLLMTIATFGAVAVRELPEAAAVMVFYSIGELLENYAVGRSRRSIQALLDIRPAYANLIRDGQICRVSPEEVPVGAEVIVRPGERVPLDGEILAGHSYVDTSALTGEPVPRGVDTGEPVLAGMMNGGGALTIKVLRAEKDSSVARIIEMVEKAVERKTPIEQFITTFSRYYTPMVVLAAALVAFVPPLFGFGSISTWGYRALILLVISCPCALVISIPLTYFGGVGAASRRGILVKGANYLEALSRMHTVVFDKTGTLTQGVFKVTRVCPAEGVASEQLLELAAAVETLSNHPIGQSVRKAYGRAISLERIRGFQEVAGLGVRAEVDGRMVLAGNERMMRHEGIAFEAAREPGAIVYIADEGRPAGYLVISDEIRDGAVEAMARLRAFGVTRLVMLTGDAERPAQAVARELGMDEFHACLLPGDKVDRLETIAARLQGRTQKMAFVGDGINDAPVIARADIGVAMGALGSDAAIEAADVVLMDESPARLADAVEIARRTGRIARQNVALALGVKGFFMLLGVAGVAGVWEAVFADVGVMVLAVFNAMRTLRGSRSDAAKPVTTCNTPGCSG